MNWKSTQNTDGGWSYSRGCSWTEPTALVLLAQTANGIDQPSFAAGAAFVRSLEGPDGGWRPQPGVAESTWVTALVGLLPSEATGTPQHRRAIDWLKGQTGRESSASNRFWQRVFGNKAELPNGWPWFPGASAWVVPTSFAILAFERELRTRPDTDLLARVVEGKHFLMSRLCADGGWNYGTPVALGQAGDSYPETTGIALLALRGMKLDRPLVAAKKQLANCRGAEGISWLRMGLAAHGEILPTPLDAPRRTVTDAALWELASAPKNPLLSL